MVGTFNTSADPADSSAHAFVWNAGVFTDLGTLGGASSQANAIGPAPDHVIVGASNVDFATWHATRWQAGTLRDLGTLGGEKSFATAVNASGVVVGSSNAVRYGPTHATLWDSEGRIHDLGTLGGTFSNATGIDASGVVVGDSALPFPARHEHAFIVTGGRMLDLNDLVDASAAGWELLTATRINEAGQITGLGLVGAVERSFVLTPLRAAIPD